MQEFANPPSLRNGIFDLLSSVELATDVNVKLLDYTIQLFKDNGLFSDYYGYHNIDHELEVTYITLLSGIHSLQDEFLTLDDLNYLYASALLHDFDPGKAIDKPHEKNVINFISKNKTIQKYIFCGAKIFQVIPKMINKNNEGIRFMLYFSIYAL